MKLSRTPRALGLVLVLPPLLGLAAACPALSWDDKGHRVVALIAAANLSDESKNAVQALLPPGTTLADAAIWPDYEGRSVREFNPLHYVSIPDGAEGYDQARDCPQRNCMVEALEWFLAAAADRRAPQSVRLIALRYAVHLAGDMHQPLHAGRAEDRGGTEIEVTYRGATTRLHFFWDRDLVEMEEGSAEELAARLMSQVTAEERREWQAGDPVDWTDESRALARSHAYDLGPGGELSDAYVERAGPVVRRRLIQAGLRLARLLNGALQ